MSDLLSSLLSTGGTSTIDRLVSQYMALERRPVDALKTTRDQLDIRSAMFSELETRMGELSDLAEALSLASGSIFESRTSTSSDPEVAVATASSAAATGSYLLENVVLARAERMNFAWVDTAWDTGSGGSFTLNGTTITMDGGKSLADLRDAINGATYAAGRGVIATVVNSTVDGNPSSILVLEGESTGAANTITIADESGSTIVSSLGAQQVTQTARDASFTINGVPVSRDKNTGLSDVVEGLTIDLKAEADQVTIQVASDTAAMRSQIEALLQKFNAVTDYLRDKSAITKGATGNYTRGQLYGYSLYTGLRTELYDVLSGSAPVSSGSPSRLSDLGIEMDSNLHFVVKDPDKLADRLEAGPDGVMELFGGSSGIAKQLFARLEPYVRAASTDSRSYLDREQDAIALERTSIDERIETLNERLARREEQLRLQFTRLQALIIDLTNQQQRLQSIFSSTSGWGMEG